MKVDGDAEAYCKARREEAFTMQVTNGHGQIDGAPCHPGWLQSADVRRRVARLPPRACDAARPHDDAVNVSAVRLRAHAAARPPLAAQVKDLPERPQLHGVRLPEQKRVLKGHIRKVQGLSWGADSRTLIAADQGGKTIIWDAFRGMKMKVISKPFTVAVAKHPTRELAATGGMDNVVSVWSTAGEDAECSLTRELEYHEGYISSLAFVGEDMMLSSSGDAEIVLWDLMTLKTKRTFLGHDGDASCIRFPAGQSDHRAFCTGSSDGTVRVWDLRSSACTHKFDVAAEVNGCAFFPSGTAVAAAAHNGCTFLFDLRSQAPLQKYSRKNNHAAAVDFSLSGRTMYVAYEDGHVCLWDPLASSENGYVQKLPAHVKTPNNDPRMRTISCMSMSPDGTALATGAFDSLIKIWGPAPAEPRASSPQA